MDDRRKHIFANEFRHARSCGHITGSQGRKAGRIHVANVAVKGDRLAVAVNKKHNPCRTFNADAFEYILEPQKLLFL
jgi:hypothetical protein